MDKENIPRREMTAKERREIKALVKQHCANYDREYGCLPLDGTCYMFGKLYTGMFCTWFQNAVLPLDPVLESALMHKGIATKPCKVCGTVFPAQKNAVYCSDKCRQTGQRRQTASRVKKHRKTGGDM